MFGWFRRKKKEKPEEKQVVQPTPKVVEEVKFEEPVQEELVQEEPVQEEPVVEEEEKPKTERSLPYHITKHPKGGWQIKRGKADRALKRFDTQKEAIEYAKELEKERGVSYIIHKADGSIRKKDY